MSEQRLSLLIAGGGLLCLLLQLVVSLTDSPVKRAQIAEHEVTYQSVRQRAEKRLSRLSTRLNAPLYENNRSEMQSQIDMTVQADPEIVEVGVVENDQDMTVWVSSDPSRIGKPLSGPVEEVVRKALGAGSISLVTDPRPDQRVILVKPLVGQSGERRTLYLEVTTAGMEDDVSKVVLALQPPRVPAWLTIGLGLFGLGAALFMLLAGDRQKNQEALHLQEIVEQMAMGHFEARCDPQDVPHLGGVAERLNAMAEQVELLQQAELGAREDVNRKEQEIQDAQVVQQTLMPEVRRITRGPLQLCGVYRSASKLSGDWWNHFALDEHRTLLVLADVVGHGIGSAVVGAMAYGCAQQLYQDLSASLRPEVLLTRLNHTISSTTRGKFTMSCFAAIIDTRDAKITFASGGHAFPLLYRPRDQQKPFIPLVAAGSPLGSDKDSKFEANVQTWEPGDLLICYTDGLIEAANPNGDQFGDKRVRQTVQKHTSHNVEEICEALFVEVARYVGKEELEDDLTLVVARLTSAST
jgi:serine phosphatase RsbU (regulator of sigma subunit)